MSIIYFNGMVIANNKKEHPSKKAIKRKRDKVFLNIYRMRKRIKMFSFKI